MADRTLICEIVTPERIMYTNEVDMIIAPTLEGEVGVLPLHMPMVVALQAGEVRVKHGDETEWFAVSGGYMQVHEDKVIVLADDAVASSQIDVERARQAREMAEQRLAEVTSSGEGDVDMCERDLKWCELQVELAGKKRD